MKSRRKILIFPIIFLLIWPVTFIFVFLLENDARSQPVIFAEEQKLTASDGLTNNHFGGSVSISDNRALIGAPRDEIAGVYSGSAYVFRYNGGTWVEEQKLTVSSDWGYLGLYNHNSWLAISGDVAVIGGYYSESAHIFRYNGSTWVEEQKLTASDAATGVRFGNCVAIGIDVVVIGAYRDQFDSGSAYVFRYNGGTWVEEQKLTASDAAAEDLFGYCVAISGNVAVIGAREDDDAGDYSGSAYVFRYNGSTWIEEQKLTASDASMHDYFGYSVAISGNVAVIGALGADSDNADGVRYGAAYVFRYNGSTWIEEQKLKASDGWLLQPGHGFGVSVMIKENVALIGAHQDQIDIGAAYVFRYNGSTWVEEQKLTASDAALDDRFGFSLDFSGNRILIGAHADDGNIGSAYLFYMGPAPPPSALTGDLDFDGDIDGNDLYKFAEVFGSPF